MNTCPDAAGILVVAVNVRDKGYDFMMVQEQLQMLLHFWQSLMMLVQETLLQILMDFIFLTELVQGQ